MTFKRYYGPNDEDIVNIMKDPPISGMALAIHHFWRIV
jgi:hypothetical protein